MVFLKRLGAVLAEEHNSSYIEIMGLLRSRLNVTLLCFCNVPSWHQILSTASGNHQCGLCGPRNHGSIMAYNL
jgi:hypothetical protein